MEYRSLYALGKEKLAAAGIRNRFENTDLTKCLKAITKHLKEAGISPK